MKSIPKQKSAARLEPTGDRMIVLPVKQAEMSRGGIHIPDVAQEKQQEGEILAVGPGRRTENGVLVPMDLKKGDRVLFGKYSGTEVTVDEKPVLIIREADVMAVIKR